MPHVPQCTGLVSRSASHPSEAAPLQLLKPWSHSPTAQAPALQVAWACASTQGLQLAGSQPWAGSTSATHLPEHGFVPWGQPPSTAASAASATSAPPSGCDPSALPSGHAASEPSCASSEASEPAAPPEEASRAPSKLGSGKPQPASKAAKPEAHEAACLLEAADKIHPRGMERDANGGGLRGPTR